MKAMLALEHYGWGESRGLSPRPGMAGIIAQVKAEAGHDIPMVIDIVTGELVKPITDYRRSTRSFNRGVLLRFVLEAGRTYRVYAHTSWKGREELQCQVSDEGEIIRLEK